VSWVLNGVDAYSSLICICIALNVLPSDVVWFGLDLVYCPFTPKEYVDYK
jgi:hypothetical protein